MKVTLLAALASAWVALPSLALAQTKNVEKQKAPTVVLPGPKGTQKKVEPKKVLVPRRPVILGPNGKPTPYGKSPYGYPPRSTIIDPVSGRTTTPYGYPPRGQLIDPVSGRRVNQGGVVSRYQFDPATGQAYPALNYATPFRYQFRYPAVYRYRYRVNLPQFRFRATYNPPNNFIPLR